MMAERKSLKQMGIRNKTKTYPKKKKKKKVSTK